MKNKSYFPVPDSGNSTLLFVEPEIGGHQLSYIQYLCDYYADHDFEDKLIFLVHPDFRVIIKTRGKTKEFEFYEKKGMRFISLAEKEYKRYLQENLFLSSLFRWKIAKRYADQHNARHIHFLSLDALQFPLSLKINLFSPYSVSGILFRVSLHYREAFHEKSFGMRVKNLRKKMLYSGLLLNKKVTQVFSLDPYLVDFSRKKYSNSEKLCKLPEPGPYHEAFKKYSQNKRPHDKTIQKNKRKMFLLFGSLRKKKGVIQTLQAVDRLEQPYLRRSLFVFAGKIRDPLKEKFDALTTRIKQKKDAKIIHLDKFITEEELLPLIESSDCILAPYQKFVGSSSVLLWAAGAKKPVITQNYGLLYKWTKDYRIGLTTNTVSSKNIAEAVKKIINGDYTIHEKSMEKFASENTPFKYAETIFSKLARRNQIKTK